MDEPEPENEPDVAVSKDGTVLTEADLDELVREAEEGYDPDKLGPRPSG